MPVMTGIAEGAPYLEVEGEKSRALFGCLSWRCLMRHPSGTVG